MATTDITSYFLTTGNFSPRSSKNGRFSRTQKLIYLVSATCFGPMDHHQFGKNGRYIHSSEQKWKSQRTLQ
jgi:hypothetical protein